MDGCGVAANAHQHGAGSSEEKERGVLLATAISLRIAWISRDKHPEPLLSALDPRLQT